MKIDIDVKSIVPPDRCGCFEIKGNSISGWTLLPTAFSEIQFSDYPKDMKDALELGKLEAKLADCITQHFAEIEKRNISIAKIASRTACPIY